MKRTVLYLELEDTRDAYTEEKKEEIKRDLKDQLFEYMEKWVMQSIEPEILKIKEVDD